MGSFLDTQEPKRVIFDKYMLSELFGLIGRRINMGELCETLKTLNRVGAESFAQIIL